jgi:hypothetical protein
MERDVHTNESPLGYAGNSTNPMTPLANIATRAASLLGDMRTGENDLTSIYVSLMGHGPAIPTSAAANKPEGAAVAAVPGLLDELSSRLDALEETQRHVRELIGQIASQVSR